MFHIRSQILRVHKVEVGKSRRSFLPQKTLLLKHLVSGLAFKSVTL